MPLCVEYLLVMGSVCSQSLPLGGLIQPRASPPPPRRVCFGLLMLQTAHNCTQQQAGVPTQEVHPANPSTRLILYCWCLGCTLLVPPLPDHWCVLLM
jgi:hypothetical protein